MEEKERMLLRNDDSVARTMTRVHLLFSALSPSMSGVLTLSQNSLSYVPTINATNEKYLCGDSEDGEMMMMRGS